MPNLAQFTLQLGEIPILVTRKDVKHMYLRVCAASGEARMTAPNSVSLEKIREFALNNRVWLESRLKKAASESEAATIPEIQNVWGKPYLVKLLAHSKWHDIRLSGSDLIFQSPNKLNFDQWQALLSHFLRRLVFLEAPPVIGRWSKTLNLEEPSLGVRRMKKRWGSCYRTRQRIILNSEIAIYPPVCLEQVIVHELLHFYEPGHGPAFHALMDQALPNWRRTAEMF